MIKMTKMRRGIGNREIYRGSRKRNRNREIYRGRRKR